MPSWKESTPPPPWTIDEAQAALAEVANSLLALVGTLEAILKGLPEPPDIDDRHEGRKAYDRATEILATIEIALEDSLRPTIEDFEKVAAVTDAELEAEWHEAQKADPPKQSLDRPTL